MALNDDERKAIRLFASTRTGRDEAVQVYHLHIKEHAKSDRNKCPEMEFMSEIVSPCPDLGYRAMLRKRILEGL